ncbi:MAG: NAD-dependent epimerase/dehydratase family protein, partial [Fimbriimonadales bacterium]|nr:NAD-dependent epimerase/dehydratase family protein [Fimbriimonadales bacterium]
ELKPLLHGCQWIWDIRREPPGLTVGTGAARSLACKRVLTIGTDMAVGKMTVSLEMHRACLQRGLRSRFLATGQTGIMIEGDGIPLDAVRVDFASGAVEQYVLRLGQDADIVHIEGQGALFNPASTATLPLLRGSQPTHLILVHRAGQTHIMRYTDVPIPPLPVAVRLYEELASSGGSFYPSRVAAIALNTAHLSEQEARAAIEQASQETGLPCTDPIRFGADLLVEAVLPAS